MNYMDYCKWSSAWRQCDGITPNPGYCGDAQWYASYTEPWSCVVKYQDGTDCAYSHKFTTWYSTYAA